MSKQNAVVRVRPIFRMLGIMICAAGLFTLYHLLLKQTEFSSLEKLSYIIALIFTCPLILASCILGRMPFFITNNLSRNILDDIEKTGNLFLENSLKTIIFSIVFLTIVFFYIFAHTIT